MVKVIIFGCGISGMTVAHELIDKGYEVEIFEKDKIIGGMAKTRRENNNIPSEHSWRGFGPHYKNFFEISKRIPISQNKTAYNNLSKPINFNMLKDISSKNQFKGHGIKENFNFFDIVLIGYIFLKYITSNKRRNEYYYLKLSNYCQKLSISARKYILNFVLGPGYGMEKKDASIGHFFKFASIRLMNDPVYNYKYSINNKNFNNTASGNWHVLNQPTNEGLFDPWVKTLKEKGLKLHLNSELIKINYIGNKIKNCEIKCEGKMKIIKSDYFVICLNPFNAEKIVKKSSMNILLKNHKMLNKKTVSNQISFRLGFYKKIKFPVKNQGFVLRDSEYNITFYSQDHNFNKNIKLSDNGKIKSLWSGTILFTTSEKGKLYNKPAIELSKNELKEEIIYQFIKCNELQDIIKKNNNFKLNKNIIKYSEIWYESGFTETSGFNQSYKKWVNNMYNEKYRPDQKTEYKNLFIGGSHTKTSVEVWSMEGAVESGKIVSKNICKKPIYLFQHTDLHRYTFIKRLDDILYKFGLPHIIDVFTFVIIYLILLKKVC